LESTKTSLPFTDKFASRVISKRRAVGASSRTREIKSEIACGEDAEAVGFGHWTAPDSLKAKQ
jgi:hypothetical protein